MPAIDGLRAIAVIGIALGGLGMIEQLVVAGA